jgi:hypothetical protein
MSEIEFAIRLAAMTCLARATRASPISELGNRPDTVTPNPKWETQIPLMRYW